MKNFLIYTFLFLSFVGGTQSAGAKPKPEIAGLRVGMKREDALKRLEKIGKKEKDESKKQEVWKLTNNPQYSHIIIAFDRENNDVRFITAKAREGGTRVRYSDVLDVKKAKQVGAINNYKYKLESPSRGKKKGYTLIASGRDADYLTYFSIKEIENGKEEDEDEDEDSN